MFQFKNKETENKTENILYFAFLFLFQLVLLFQGLDLSDEGFLSTFYYQIFKNPASVEFSFVFWFCGIIGGLYEIFFSQFGLFGLRVGGIIITTLTAFFTYNILKGYLNRSYLKFGLFLVIMLNNNALKIINYNNLSALFYVLSIYYLFKGVKENKWHILFLAGLFISVNTFTRLPNILELGLISGIFYYNILHKNKLKQSVIQSLHVFSGFFITTAGLFLIMKLIGHFEIFMDSMSVLLNLGKVNEQVSTEHNFYGAFRLFNQFISNYKQAIKYSVVFFAILFILNILYSLLNRIKLNFKLSFDLIKYSIVILTGYFIMNDYFDNIFFLFLYAGIIVITGVILISTNGNKDLKTIMFCGIFVMLTFPVASSAGITTAGRYAFWIALPIAIDYLFTLDSLKNRSFLNHTMSFLKLKFVFTEKQIRWSINTAAFIFLLSGLYHSYNYPFFDQNDRFSMRYPIHNKYLKNIYTTKGRADAMNELLAASAKYVKPNQYVLAYERIPQYYYLTETTPYLKNTLVWLYHSEEFKNEMNDSFLEKKVLPVIVCHKISTFGENKGWPYDIKDESIFEKDKNLTKNKYLDDFIVEHNYSRVWENNIFSIMVPPSGDRAYLNTKK